jgi:hypothetical protein
LAEIIERDGQTAWQKTIRALHLLHHREILEQHRFSQPPINAVLATVFSFCETGTKLAYSYGVKFQLNQLLPNGLAANGKAVISILERINYLTEHDPATLRPAQFEKIFCNQVGQELLLAMHVHELALGEHRAERERLQVAMRLADDPCERARQHGGKIPNLVSGRDIQGCGLVAGPQYREILKRVRDAQLSGIIHDKPEALELIRMCIHEL